MRKNLPGGKILVYCAFGMLFLLAIILRASFYYVQTSDYTVFVSQWYDHIKTYGFAAFKDNFSNYNVPYLYLLGLTTLLPIPKLIAIKSLSVVFDGVLGIFTYLIISLKYPRSLAAIIGALVIVFAPTIFINSAAWGQCDAIYASFCLGSLYFLLKNRPGWAYVFFGLAFSFKLQAIFFLPVLLVLLLKRKLPVKYFVLIPLIFLLLLVPAFVAGRDAWSLLTIYTGQINSGGVGGQFNGGGQGRPGQFNGGGPGQGNGGGPGRFNGGGSGQANAGGSGQFNGGRSGQGNGGGLGQFNGRGFGGGGSSSLTLNAPGFYQWLPASAPAYWKWVGIGLAGLFVVLVGVLVQASKREFTTDIVLKVTLVFALAIPFLLPEMHERYFYLADVVSIIYAFYFPRYFFIPVIMQLCSLISYAPYFLSRQVVSLSYAAVGVLVITVITFVDLVLTLYPDIRKKVTKGDAPKDAVFSAS